MFSGIKRFLGNITVEVKGDEIFVEGVEADIMAKDIKAIWGTNKINTHLFTQMSKNSFSLPSFFAPDVLYTLEQMTQKPSLKVSVRTLTKVKELLLQNTWLAQTLKEPYSKLDLSRLKDFKLTLFDFQLDFLKTYDKLTGQYNLNGFLLNGAAGSGKTLTALALTHCLNIDRIIVIAPKNAINRVWEDSLLNHFKKPPTYWLSTSDKPFKGNERFIVGHYESLEKVAEIAKQFRNEDVAIILDESHNFNGLASLRTARFIDLCKDTDSREVIWLSGTPIKALAAEAIPLFRCIDPLFTEDVEKRFKKIYGDDSGRGVDILKNRMGIVSFKVEKKELNLRDPIFKEIKVSIPHGHDYTLKAIKEVMAAFIKERVDYYGTRKASDEKLFAQGLELFEITLRSQQQHKEYAYYRECLKKVIKAQGDFAVKEEMFYCNKFELNKITPQLPNVMRAEWKNVRSIIKYVHLKIQGECLGRILGGLRIQAHVDMVTSIDFKAVCESTKKKTVVFTSFTRVVERCEEYLPTLGLSPLLVYGKTNANLNSTIATFEKDEDANPLVATYASLSTAVPLVMADTMILIDSPFRDYILTQAVSRIHRIGSDTQCYVYNVSLDTGDEVNISTRSMDILKWSQSAVEAITGIRAPFELTDNPESFSAALEGLDAEPLRSVAGLKPSFLNF
jgi:superfamily II DNA or RNA helicase